jgi:nucleoside-diphosphate-sugar epimerase
MRVLVTGGMGFTGSHLVRRLLNRGHEVSVIDIGRGLFYDELKDKGASIELGSITDPAFVNKMVKDSEVVYHVAAAFRQMNVPSRFYWNVNVEGTRNLLAAAYEFKVRKFINCGTAGVYGHVKNPPADEKSPISPADYYQLTKYEGEKLVQHYVEEGLNAITLLPVGIYGPGDPGRFLILFRLVKRGRFLMLGSGETFYHTVFIENLIDAFELVAERDDLSGRRFIIADENYYSLNELVEMAAVAMGSSIRIQKVPFWPVWLTALGCEMFCKAFGLSPPIFRRRIDWFRQVRAFSIETAKKEIGYKPRVSTEDGFLRTVEWYKTHGYL